MLHNPNIPKNKKVFLHSFFSPFLSSLFPSLSLSLTLSCFLAAMPVQSKIVGPYVDDDDTALGLGNQDTWSSPHSDYLPSGTFYERGHDLGLSRDSAPGFYVPGSRASASFSHSGSTENGSDVDGRSISDPRSLGARSHITIPSDSPPVHTPHHGLEAEVRYLRKINEELLGEIEKLKGRADGLSYVICLSHQILANYLGFYSIRDAYNRLVDGLSQRVDETRKDV